MTSFKSFGTLFSAVRQKYDLKHPKIYPDISANLVLKITLKMHLDSFIGPPILNY